MEKLTAEQAKKYLAMEGEARGVVFQTDKEYILMKKGEGGLKELDKRAGELGADIPYQAIAATNWYPIGMRVISILLIAEVFGWSDKEIREMGSYAPKVSFMVKLMMKFFVSLEKFTMKTPYYWKMHFSAGKLEVKGLDEKKREAIVHIKDIELPRLYLDYLEGYFGQMFAFVLGKGNIRESKFTEKEGYYEYCVRWQKNG